MLWATLSALLIGTLIGTMGNSMVSVALPSLMEYYSIPLTQAVWSITLYTLTFSVLIPVFGSISRSIGYLRLFVGGMVFVTIGSLLCIIAPGYFLFICARICIGIGVASVLPTIMGVVSNYFPLEIQGKAIGYWALVNSLGHALGPTIAGFLLDRFSWQSIFWVNLPLSIASIILALSVFVRAERIPSRGFDWPGAAGTIFLVFSLMLFITEASETGINSIITIVLIVCGVLSLYFVLHRELRLEHPFLDLKHLSNIDYLASIVPISLQAFTQFGLLVSLPVFLIELNGIDKQVAGVIIMSMTLMMAITSLFAGRLTDKWSSKWVCLLGTILVGMGALAMVIFRVESLALWNWICFIFCLIVFGMGFGMIQSGSTVAAIQSSPKESTGVNTGFFHMIRFINASLGSTIFGIFFESGSEINIKGFYNSFILIIVLALITIPFVLHIKPQYQD